jgi:hypothetical protein
MGTSGMSTLHLYRNILRAAQYFPSKKKNSIIKTIKEEFRSSKVTNGKASKEIMYTCFFEGEPSQT